MSKSRKRRSPHPEPAHISPETGLPQATGWAVNLDKVDFAALLDLIEPLSFDAKRVAEREADGVLGETGHEMLSGIRTQFADPDAPLFAALTAAGMGDRHTAWMFSTTNQKRLTAATALRELSCNVRRGDLRGTTWQLANTDDETLTYSERPPDAPMTCAILAKRLCEAVELLREVPALLNCPPERDEPNDDSIDKTKTDKAPEGDPPLSPLQYDILQALRTSNATDAEKSNTAIKIAGKVGGDATEQSCKAPLAALKKHGLVDSKTGRHGGSWLTANGLDLINRIRPRKKE